MTALMMTDPELTMSSREIAELVESRHDSVKRTMETLQNKGVISFTQSVETSHQGPGSRPVTVLMVNKRDSYVVVAQLCPEFTARLVDRWQELEQQVRTAPVLPDFTDPVVAARAWADQLEKRALAEQQNALLEHKVAEQAPKAQFHDDVASSINAQTFDQVAKELRTGRIRLCRWLREQGYLMHSNEPYQRYIDQGLFRMVPRVRRDQRTGENINYSKTLITGKGLTHIYHRIQELAECIDLLAEDGQLEQGQRRITRH